MSKNKYPEKTRALILEQAFILFKEKGYENIVMQDIIDATGFSRGAVYHHFSNKSDIMNAVLEIIFQNDTVFLEKIIDSSLTALEKADAIIDFVVSDSTRKELSYGLWIQNNPIVLLSNIQNTLFNAAPAISQIIEQGVNEGIFKTDYPTQAAELIMLLLNIWLDPSLCNGALENYISKIDFLLDTLTKIGVPIISKPSECKLRQYYVSYFEEEKGVK